MNKRPHILITNDDGVHAPGIKHLWNALKPVADLTVVAPAFEQSCVGLSTTLRMPLRLEKIVTWNNGEEAIWSVDGTPADCIKIALHAVLKSKPDLVVSGINRGGNMGQSALYSGTVAATIESAIQNIPAIAFSCNDFKLQPNYELAAQHTPHFVEYVLAHPLPNGTILNVNFPGQELGDYKGIKMTTQGKDWWGEEPDRREHPEEGHYYWLGGKLRVCDAEEENDGIWLRRGYITAVPIHVKDLTDHKHLACSREHFENHFTTLKTIRF